VNFQNVTHVKSLTTSHMWKLTKHAQTFKTSHLWEIPKRLSCESYPRVTHAKILKRHICERFPNVTDVEAFKASHMWNLSKRHTCGIFQSVTNVTHVKYLLTSLFLSQTVTFASRSVPRHTVVKHCAAKWRQSSTPSSSRTKSKKFISHFRIHFLLFYFF
jgi:hypothetical protein